MTVPCTEHGWTWARQVSHYSSEWYAPVLEVTVQCPTCGYWVWADEADEG